MGWSEKLIEQRNSWFSPKELSGLRHMFPLGVEHWKVSTVRNDARPIKLRIPEVKNMAVRRWGRSSIRQKGNSPDRQLRSLNLRSVQIRRWNFPDSQDVGLEAATIQRKRNSSLT